MAKPKKDEVLNNPENNAEPGGGTVPPSSATAASSKAADSQESAAHKKDAEGGKTSETEASSDELVATAQQEAKEWQDKYMRLHAEWDTYRRRTDEQRREERTRATESLVESLLPVIDDFERTIDYAQEKGEKGLLGGVEAVHVKLVDALKKDGVEIIDPLGEAFDALEAQAVATNEDKSVPDETVSDVYQKGYKMGKKVLRPAMVTVSTGGPKRPPEEKEQD